MLPMPAISSNFLFILCEDFSFAGGKISVKQSGANCQFEFAKGPPFLNGHTMGG